MKDSLFLSPLFYYKQWENLPCEPKSWQEKYDYQTDQIPTFISSLGNSILDVGCGVCHQALHYHDYLGVDVTRKFLRQTRAPRVQASCFNLPFRDKSFDVVYAKDLLIHLLPEDWKPCLAELFRVARKYAVTVDACWHENTEYIQKEQYGNLAFYNNAYGQKETIAYALGQGVRQIQFFQAPQAHRQITMYHL